MSQPYMTDPDAAQRLISGSLRKGSIKPALTPQASTSAEDPTTEDPIVADPITPCGQKIGALLRIKSMPLRMAQYGDFPRINMPQVGDLVIIQKHENIICHGINWRTKEKCKVYWSCFFPLGIMDTCECQEGFCRCEMVDHVKHMEYQHYISKPSSKRVMAGL